jgi:hypothetical protein
MRRKLLHSCSTLAIVVILCAPDSLAQDVYHGGAMDARQHGYEHGYREGFAFGQNSQVSNREQDIVNQKLRQADKDYQPAFGSQDAYRQGYAEGFRAGMEDSRAGNRSKLEDLFRARDPNYNPDRRVDDRIDGIYPRNQWPATHAANDIGYRDGFDAGLQDRQAGRRFQPRQHQAWQTASHGYDRSYGSQSQYKSAYRAGYELGYRDGFGKSR